MDRLSPDAERWKPLRQEPDVRVISYSPQVSEDNVSVRGRMNAETEVRMLSFAGSNRHESVREASSNSSYLSQSNSISTEDDETTFNRQWAMQRRSFHYEGDDLDDEDSLVTNTAWFRLCIGVVICLNIFIVGLEASFQQVTEWRTTFGIIEAVFSTIYVGETTLRIYETRLYFFYEPWNWFDFIVNLASVCDTTMFLAGSSGVGVAAIRIFRVFRILRLFRAFPFIDVVVASTVSATGKLAILFLLLLFVFSILLTNMLGDIDDPIAQKRFGNLGRSMYTVFKLLTIDDWVGIAEHADHLHPGLLYVFALLVFLGPLAITALVPPVLIEIGSIDKERKKERDAAWQHHRNHAAKKKVLHRLFSLTDKDGEGYVSVEQLILTFDSSDARKMVKTHDLTVEEDLRDMKLSLFQLWEDRADDEVDGPLREDEFIDGMLRIWGDISMKVIWRAVTSTRMHVMPTVMEMWRPKVHKTFHRVKRRKNKSRTSTFSQAAARKTRRTSQLSRVSARTATIGCESHSLARARNVVTSNEIKTMIDTQSEIVDLGFRDLAKEVQRLTMHVESLRECGNNLIESTSPAAIGGSLMGPLPTDLKWDALVVDLREERAILETLHKRFDEFLRQLERHHEDCEGKLLALYQKIDTSLNTRFALQPSMVGGLVQPKQENNARMGHRSDVANRMTVDPASNKGPDVRRIGT